MGWFLLEQLGPRRFWSVFSFPDICPGHLGTYPNRSKAILLIKLISQRKWRLIMVIRANYYFFIIFLVVSHINGIICVQYIAILLYTNAFKVRPHRRLPFKNNQNIYKLHKNIHFTVKSFFVFAVLVFLDFLVARVLRQAEHASASFGCAIRKSKNAKTAKTENDFTVN